MVFYLRVELHIAAHLMAPRMPCLSHRILHRKHAISTEWKVTCYFDRVESNMLFDITPYGALLLLFDIH